MNAADSARWPRGALVRHLKHLLCCDPQSGPCALWRETRPPNAPSGTSDWSPWELAVHSRADLSDALLLLWDWTPDPSWWSRADRRFQSLPQPAQGLWILIARGPADERIAELPRGYVPRSWAGTLRWRDAEQLLHRNKVDIRADIEDALDAMAAVLNGPEPVVPPVEYRMACAPGRHVWSVGGVPHPDQRCYCFRVRWRDVHALLDIRIL